MTEFAYRSKRWKAGELNNLVGISVEKLRVGHVLTHSLYGAGGVLLLAAGSEITAERLQNLKLRGIVTVIVSAADAAHFTGNANHTSPAKKTETSPTPSGGYRIRNSGPPVRDSVVKHGRKPYTPRVLEKNAELKQENCVVCTQVFKDVFARKDVDGNVVTNLSASQLRLMAEDIAATLSVVLDTNQESNIVEESVNSSMLGMAIAVEMGLDFSNVSTVGTAACLANLGRVQMPRSARMTNGKMSLSDRLELQKVPGRSLDWLERVSGIPDIVRVVVYQTYERVDGSGYPRGLAGEKIHLFARTLQVSREFHGMLEGGGKQEETTPYQAMERMLRLARERLVDLEIVRHLLYLLSLYPIGSLVRLSDGSIARVLRSNSEHYTRPVVGRVMTADAKMVDEADERNIVDLLDCDLTVVQALSRQLQLAV